MVKKTPLLICFGLLLIAAPAFAGDVVDRIVATVNGHIILQSDWDDAARYEAFMHGRPLAGITPADRKGALDRLIDQELLTEQINVDSLPANVEDVARRLADVRRRYDPSGADQIWHAALNQYQLTEDELKARIGKELGLMGLVDARLRPSVEVDSKSIESYYNQELLPQLRQSGAAPVPLGKVSSKIKEVLTQQKVSELLVGWLQTLRAESEIHSEVTKSGPPDEVR